MTCDGDEDSSLAPRIVELFAEFEAVDAVGRARLHAIELEILEALRARPFRTWCLTAVVLLEGIVRKAQGQR